MEASDDFELEKAALSPRASSACTVSTSTSPQQEIGAKTKSSHSLSASTLTDGGHDAAARTRCDKMQLLEGRRPNTGLVMESKLAEEGRGNVASSMTIGNMQTTQTVPSTRAAHEKSPVKATEVRLTEKTNLLPRESTASEKGVGPSASNTGRGDTMIRAKSRSCVAASHKASAAIPELKTG
ncbi:unnamed protein product, partial [Amoebophrya sp. A25]|eukprot:GSA25T00011056001.1